VADRDELTGEPDDLADLDAPEATGYDGPPLDPAEGQGEPVDLDAGDEPKGSGRVLPFAVSRPRKPRKPRPEKAPGTVRTLPPKGKARDALRDDLAAGVAAIGIAASLGLPTTGHVIAGRATPIADATLKLAETNPAVAAALVATSTGMTYLDLGTHAGAILVALMVDRGVMDPYAFPAATLGVSQAWEETHPDDVAGPPAGHVVPGPAPATPPPPPAYIGV